MLQLIAGNGTASLVAPELIKALDVNRSNFIAHRMADFPNHHPDPTDPAQSCRSDCEGERKQNGSRAQLMMEIQIDWELWMIKGTYCGAINF